MPRFIILIQSHSDIEAGKMPAPEHMKAIGEYHESLAKSGKLLWADGFLPSAKDAARVQAKSSGAEVIKGPFEDPKMVLSGYWVVNCADYDAALEIAKNTPGLPDGTWMELRRLVGPEDLAGVVPPEAMGKMKEMHEQMQKNQAAFAATMGA